MPATPDFKERLAKITQRNLKVKHKSNSSWPMEKKIEVVSQFLVLGNLRMVAASTGVGYDLVRQWKIQPWWKELESEIRQTQNIEMDTKLSKIVDKSLDAVLDRVENGEFVYNSKTKKLDRRPATLKDVHRVSTDMISKRELIRGNATERKETTQIPIQEQLKLLAAEFARWQSKSSNQIIDVEMVEVVQTSDERPSDREVLETRDEKDQGNQENQMASDAEFPNEVYDSDEQGRLGSSDEGQQD